MVEYFFETLYNFVESLLGPRLTRKYFWYFGTIFTHHPGQQLHGAFARRRHHYLSWGSPFPAGRTPDLNVTMFLGLFYAVMWLYWSIREQGLKHFFLHLFGPKGGMKGFMGGGAGAHFHFRGDCGVPQHCHPAHCAGRPFVRKHLRR